MTTMAGTAGRFTPLNADLADRTQRVCVLGEDRLPASGGAR